MMKKWRENLFQSQNNADICLSPLGFPLSQARGIKTLGICLRTWKRWEKLALLIPEYKLQQIQMRNRASQRSATAPIVPYQVWVIGKIGEIYQGLPNGMSKGWMAEEWVKAKQDEFTRDAYRQEQERYSTLVLETSNV